MDRAFNYNAGLMEPDAFAERYVNYQMGKPDAEPHQLAMHVTLVGNAMSDDKNDSLSAKKIYEHMDPDVRSNVRDTLDNTDYCDKFIDGVADRYGVMPSDSLRKGIAADLSQTVDNAQAKLYVLTPMQNVCEFARQNGATGHNIKPIISSAIQDMGQYIDDADNGHAVSDNSSFRCNSHVHHDFVDYNIDARSHHIAMTGADGVTHDYFDGEAGRIMQSAINKGSLHDAVDQSFDHDSVNEMFDNTANISQPVTTRMEIFRNDKPYFTAVSTYTAQNGKSVNEMIRKDTAFEDANGRSDLTPDEQSDFAREYRLLGFSGSGNMSVDAASADIHRHFSDQFDEDNNVTSHGVDKYARYNKTDIVIGDTHFDMDALSSAIKSQGAELCDDRGNDVTIVDPSHFWKIDKKSGSPVINIGFSAGNASVPVFDMKVSEENGVEITNVNLPNVKTDEVDAFKRLAKQSVERGYSDMGIKFDTGSDHPAAHMDRELPNIDFGVPDNNVDPVY